MKSSLYPRKLALAALLLAAVLFLSGCNLIVKDPAVDAKQVIITINGENVTKEEFVRNYNNTYERKMQEQQIYQQYGLPTQPIKPEQVMEETYTSTIKDKVLHQQAHTLGLDEMTQEETAQITKQAEDNFQNIKDQVKQYYFADTKLEGDALEEEIIKKAKELGYDLDTFKQSATEGKLHEKLHAYAGNDIKVTEEDIQAKFDEKVEKAKEDYASNPASFGTALTSGQTTYYTPAGYRAVRQILVKLSDEDQEAIKGLEAEIAPLKTALDTAIADITRLETVMKSEEELEETDQAFKTEQLAALSEDEAKQFLELLKKETLSDEEGQAFAALKTKLAPYAKLPEAQAAYDAKLEELTALQDKAFAAIQEKTDEIYAKVTAQDADFDALIKEYNEDLGQPDTGYPVHESTTSFVQAFKEGAMALKKAGDISQPIKTNYGYHILRYTTDYEEGPAKLEDVKETIEKEIFSAKQDEKYQELETKWLTEAEVTRYPERMKD
ncbi:MAG: hypothetical protein GXZ04_07640 [Clostridiales bacterium]|nr:hypothetical protein [Clostridiales bacterium]